MDTGFIEHLYKKCFEAIKKKYNIVTEKSEIVIFALPVFPDFGFSILFNNEIVETVAHDQRCIELKRLFKKYKESGTYICIMTEYATGGWMTTKEMKPVVMLSKNLTFQKFEVHCNKDWRDVINRKRAVK